MRCNKIQPDHFVDVNKMIVSQKDKKMDWCPYCKKYTELCMRKMQVIKKMLLIYHCAGCGKFVKTEEIVGVN